MAMPISLPPGSATNALPIAVRAVPSAVAGIVVSGSAGEFVLDADRS